jgi:hypothetical protein
VRDLQLKDCHPERSEGSAFCCKPQILPEEIKSEQQKAFVVGKIRGEAENL